MTAPADTPIEYERTLRLLLRHLEEYLRYRDANADLWDAASHRIATHRTAVTAATGDVIRNCLHAALAIRHDVAARRPAPLESAEGLCRTLRALTPDEPPADAVITLSGEPAPPAPHFVDPYGLSADARILIQGVLQIRSLLLLQTPPSSPVPSPAEPPPRQEGAAP